jgi:Rrf2 family protein
MLSQTVEYALRAVVFLAQEPQTPRTTTQISEKVKVPLSYLRKIMQQLAKATIVESQRGKNGGFLLLSTPNTLTVLQVINAIDPIRPLDCCPLKENSTCTSLCPLHSMLQRVGATLQQEFASVFLSDLLVPSIHK